MAIYKPLDELVSGDVVTPDHPDYPAAIARWAKNAERNAAVVVFVKDGKDVAAALKYAKEHDMPIAIRGGGHNAAGASSVSNGMVIDLSRHLNKVYIDTSRQLGFVGGGCVWKDVDVEAMKYGLATVGGTVNHTGVAGLTLGGGYGWLSGKHGLAADNVRQVTLVTADGSILTVNDKENADLFWAIRGGGCNFGVVTEFVFQLYPQRKTVFAGFLVLQPPAIEKVVEVTKSWWPTANDRSAMCQIVTVGPDGKMVRRVPSASGVSIGKTIAYSDLGVKPVLVLLLFYNGSEAEGRSEFKPFYDIGMVIADMAKEIPFEELNGLQNAMSEHGRGCYLKGVSQNTPNTGSMMQMVGEVDKAAQGGFVPAVIYEYFPLHKINSVPIQATAFRRETTPNVLITLAWDAAKDRTEEARSISNEIVSTIMKSQVGLTESEKFGYTNYDTDNSALEILNSSGNTDRAKSAFGPNYPRLQRIKQQFDPENTFNRWFPIIPVAA